MLLETASALSLAYEVVHLRSPALLAARLEPTVVRPWVYCCRLNMSGPGGEMRSSGVSFAFPGAAVFAIWYDDQLSATVEPI